jgi:hypothetical protein
MGSGELLQITDPELEFVILAAAIGVSFAYVVIRTVLAFLGV